MKRRYLIEHLITLHYKNTVKPLLEQNNVLKAGARCTSLLINGAHSFRRPAEFRAEPRNLGFCRGINRGINRGIRFSAEFDIFHSNNYFSTENDLKIALLQVCL